MSDIVLSPAAALEVLLLEEETLRALNPTEGAMGHNYSDYRHLWNLFTQVVTRANALNDNPKAFVTEHGVNERVLSAWTKMISTANKILTDLNKIRNQDRMVSNLLDTHAKAFTQEVCARLGVEIKEIITLVEGGSEQAEVVRALKILMYNRVPEVFLKSAVATLQSSKSEFGLVL